MLGYKDLKNWKLIETIIKGDMNTVSVRIVI